MAVTTLSTIMPPPTRDNYKTKKCILWNFYPAVTLTLDLLTVKFDAFILATMSVIHESLVKFRQQIGKISCYQCLFEMHAWMHGQTHEHSRHIMPPDATVTEAINRQNFECLKVSWPWPWIRSHGMVLGITRRQVLTDQISCKLDTILWTKANICMRGQRQALIRWLSQCVELIKEKTNKEIKADVTWKISQYRT